MDDRSWLMRGTRRTTPGRFALWLLPWAVLLLAGVYAAARVLLLGLNQTNMDNRFAFGLWIFADLAFIALGAGAFFTGFLVYILRWDDLRAVLNSAVVLGFICYSGAIALLVLDVGQPLRAWFTFWHPNVHSMLTEVTFCITCYLMVLAIEYVPLVLRNRRLREVPSFLVFEFRLHKVMPVFAALGAFLSFFHQGSLGGLFGVMRGRPFAFREGLAIWPSTFFLFILSAIAAGPAFVMLTTRLVEGLTRRRLVPDAVYARLGRLSGRLILAYVAFKGIDTLIWINRTAPATGAHPFRFYAFQPFGTWILFAEVVLLGLVPGLMLLGRRASTSEPIRLAAAGLVCAGIVLNRFVMTIQTLSLPTLPFEGFAAYLPSWQEVACFAGFVAYGVLLYSLSYRYLPLFPKERALDRA
jgi:molybdopterin-containing oxidoreductase family membrane subunit